MWLLNYFKEVGMLHLLNYDQCYFVPMVVIIDILYCNIIRIQRSVCVWNILVFFTLKMSTVIFVDHELVRTEGPWMWKPVWNIHNRKVIWRSADKGNQGKYCFLLCMRQRYYLHNSPLSNVVDHQVAADVKGDFLSNFLHILIIFK